jgi:putative peptide zinc metalloprotease protein
MAEFVPNPLRETLKIRRQVLSNEVCYIVKEPEKQSYFRFDEGQYSMLALLDGVTALPKLVDVFNGKNKAYEYDLESAQELYTSARGCGLITRTREEEHAALRERLRETRKQKFLQRKGSVMLMRFHFVDPNRFFDRIVEPLGFMWHPIALRVGIGIMALAFLLILTEASRFGSDFLAVSSYVFGSLTGLLTAWPVIMVVIALHECAHGLTCKHYGGEVHDMGFLLLMLINPCLYCNINDAWLFDDKRHKMHTVLAGIYFELLLGACAVFVWYFTNVDSTVGRMAFVIITVCMGATVVFNLNPLMKLDGYYLLSDWLEIPNLRQNALAMISWTLKRKLFFLDPPAPLLPTAREKKIFYTYGTSLCLYLTTVFGKLFSMGYGFVANSLGFLGALGFLVVAYKFFSKMLGSWPTTLAVAADRLFWKGNRKRYTLGGGVLLLLLLFLWSPRIGVMTPCVLDADKLVIHTPETGFVAEAAFGADRRPLNAPGQTLLRLSSPDLELAHAQLGAKRQTLAAEKRMAEAVGEGGTLRRLGTRERTLGAESSSLSDRARALTVAVPAGEQGEWVVEGPPPESLLGRYYAKGDPILSLIPRKRLLALATLDQADLSHVSPGQEVHILLPHDPWGPIVGVVSRIGSTGRKEGQQQQFEVRIIAVLPPDRPLPPPGLTGRALIMGEHQPLWRHIVRPLKSMLRFDLWI